MSETKNIPPFINPNSDTKSVNQTENAQLNNREQNDVKSTEKSEVLSPEFDLGRTAEMPKSPSGIASSACTRRQEVGQHNNIDWHKIAHKLREHNRKLLKQVFQLEQEVSETNNRIEEHKARSQSTDMLIAQQAEEINHNQDEIARFREEIEVAQQEINSQQVLIESLTKELEIANENLAEVEKDRSLLKEKYQQQTHDLSLKIQQIQELSTRLTRQQHYTLQYKAALDEYLDVASSGQKSEIKIDNDFLPTYPQPVQAWSKNLTPNKKNVTVPSDNLEILAKENNSSFAPSTFEAKLKSSSNNSQKNNWPSPVINNSDRQQKPHPLSAVKLPKFQHPETGGS